MLSRTTTFLPLVSAVVLAGSFCSLQAAPPEPAPNARVDTVLHAWEEKGHSIREVRCAFECVKTDAVFGSKEISRGRIWYVNPDLFRLDWLDRKDQPEWALYVAGGVVHFYEFAAQRETTIPRSFTPDYQQLGWLGKLAYRCFWGLITQPNREPSHPIYWCIPVEQIKDRFDVRLVKEDANWVCLELEPKKRKDQRHVQLVQVVLDKRTSLVQIVQITDAIGSYQTWTLKRVQTNVKPPLCVEALSRNLPKGWKRIDLSKVWEPIDPILQKREK
jgi:TIGR03009 family protein